MQAMAPWLCTSRSPLYYELEGLLVVWKVSHYYTWRTQCLGGNYLNCMNLEKFGNHCSKLFIKLRTVEITNCSVDTITVGGGGQFEGMKETDMK